LTLQLACWACIDISILQENKFRLFERHLLCSFDEKKDQASSPKRYAHMNFYVLRDSKAKRLRHLVFAEFVKTDTDDGTGSSWTLLSCKILTKTIMVFLSSLVSLKFSLHKFVSALSSNRGMLLSDTAHSSILIFGYQHL
jgi:hypothetical protein